MPEKSNAARTSDGTAVSYHGASGRRDYSVGEDVAHADPAALTILTTFGPLATKRVTPAGIEAFGRARRFRWRAERVLNLPAMEALLRKQAARSREFAMRAAALATTALCCRRLLHPDTTTGDPATFIEVPRSWAAFDFDSVPAPAALDPVHEPEAAADFLRALLPDPFHEAGCVWQATSSLGLKPGLRYRLWFLLSRPLLGRELAAWCARPELDPCIFRPLEPIYTASPVFQDRPDPVPGRIGRLDGLAERVEVPAVLSARAPRPSQTGNGAAAASPGFDGWLARMGDGEGLHRFRAPILSALASYARRHGPKALLDSAEGLKRRIRKRLGEAPRAADRGDALDRYASDQHLDEIIVWLVQREQGARRGVALAAVRSVLRTAS